MRTLFAAALLSTLPLACAHADPVLTEQQAEADIVADGFTRAAFVEHSDGNWNLWASKDGLAFEVQLDAHTGAIVRQLPLDFDD